MIPTKYPSGGAKQLTQILTGKQVPHGGRSSDIGILMQNVGTAYAVKRAVIDGEPLTERVVTLTGGKRFRARATSGPGWARRYAIFWMMPGFCPSAEPMVIMGGPLMGFTLPWLDVPVVKITNCLLAPSASEMGEAEEEKGCIRCSACADACPADLLPQQLYWFSKGQQHDKATTHNLADCIECGAAPGSARAIFRWCSTSVRRRPRSRRFVWKRRARRKPKPRFEARQARLERDKAARLERHKQSAVQPAAKDSAAINAALARVREKQQDAAQPIVVQAGAKPDNSEAIAAREARKAQARARKNELAESAPEPSADADLDPRKAAVEAAIARAKARKAEQQQAEATTAAPEAEAVDPRKAAVEAAIARAKARKAEQQAEVTTVAPEAEAVDPRKAAVEAAIARAKARKAEQQAEATAVAPEAEAVDPRKAAVEAAIARAKARKAEQQAEATTTAPEAEAVDPRKAVVAAAIARAKARKAEQQQAEATTVAPEAEAVDPRKAAVEAAIARAKASKAEQQQAGDVGSAANDDPRKAAVAEAIARVQARKASRQAVNED
ncbi:Nitrogen fixation protein rnfC [Raoultella terrigena]|uniref:Ion-translocating oxidoreductase complex subunit C n=1 Tax=Raoultella terrigena TaxID=577 RepID=A0A4U9D050_RAOTE|nr:Nitrogen fixation protein rnfC [Raoultella terrigena]